MRFWNKLRGPLIAFFGVSSKSGVRRGSISGTNSIRTFEPIRHQTDNGKRFLTSFLNRIAYYLAFMFTPTSGLQPSVQHIIVHHLLFNNWRGWATRTGASSSAASTNSYNGLFSLGPRSRPAWNR